MEDIDLNRSTCKITLKLHGVIEDSFSKKLIIQLRTHDNSIDYIKYRSSSDFIHLRQQLLKKWVSFTIPSFPKISLSILSSTSERYLIHKLKYLQFFLNSCLRISEIYNSPDFQIFIKGPENFIESSKLTVLDYKDLEKRYKYIYDELPVVEINSGVLNENSLILKEMLSEIQAFKRKIKGLCNKFQEICENHSKFVLEINRVREEYLKAVVENVELEVYGVNLEVNPFVEILAWATEQCLILKSSIESIDKFFGVISEIEVMNRKALKKKNFIASLEAGKVSFTSIFARKSSSEIVDFENNTVTEIDSSVASAISMQKMLYSYLVTQLLPSIKVENLKKYVVAFRAYSDSNLKCYEKKVLQ